MKLGFEMMADINRAQGDLFDYQFPNRSNVRVKNKGAKLLETMIILDWEMYIMAKGIIWDRKRIPESMITIKNIKTYNQYAREAITYSRQRFEALAAKMRRKAAALPGQLISS